VPLAAKHVCVHSILLVDRRHSRVRRVDRATPRSGLVASLLDELLETFEIATHASARDAHGVADVLDDTFGVVLELQHDAGLVVSQSMEGHDTGVAGAPDAVPRHTGVRNLLADLGFPGLLLEPDDGSPDESAIVELADFLHAFHEARELLELRPLVVRRANRNVHVDGLLYLRHDRPPSGRRSPLEEIPQVPCHAAAWRTRGKRAMHRRFGVELTRPGLQLRR